MGDDAVPSLRNVLELQSLKWVFCGGKGGVGKTTTSCSLGIQLAAVRRNVLIVSTDPAHNLSDAFGQKFGRQPTAVTGFSNLFCMELDPTVDSEEDIVPGAEGSTSGGMPTAAAMSGLLREYGSAIPGIDELMSFAELMRHVQRLEYDITVFDTAPTGHTLRLLSLPGLIDKALSKLLGMRATFGPLLNMAGSIAPGGLPSETEIVGMLEGYKTIIDAVQARIHDPAETTFVCVCIPEFLSLYETERLVQELSKFDIDTHNIVVNQVLFAEEGSGGHLDCARCAARMRMQARYLEQISDLYGADFHVVRTPLLSEEVRGPTRLSAFGTMLLDQYAVGGPLPAGLEASKSK